jgi:protein-S-isoprenylcysteine O-methyltransferase Ste14
MHFHSETVWRKNSERELRMRGKNTRKDVYATSGRSVAERVAMTAAVGTCVGVAWWLLFGGGIGSVGTWLGRPWTAGDTERRLCLGVTLSIYFVRLLFTQFVFLKRAVSWAEACMIVPWVLCIYLLLSIAGGTNSAPFGTPGAVGTVLFALGSWVNSYAEYTRHTWKRRPENHGRLYTLGLFRFSRHPNYLGDLIAFSGLCLIAGRWVTIAIPLIMLAGFVFANVPMLDLHLHDHYGSAFDEYAARTRKLIPFVY